MDASLAVTVLVFVTLAGREAEEKKPRDLAYLETIRGFEKRLAAKDIDGSLSLFGTPDQPGGAVRLRLRIERMAKGWDAKTFQVADHRGKGSCAVAMLLEKPEDPDPMYLVRRQDGWRILPEVTRYRKGTALGRVELADFEEQVRKILEEGMRKRG